MKTCPHCEQPMPGPTAAELEAQRHRLQRLLRDDRAPAWVESELLEECRRYEARYC